MNASNIVATKTVDVPSAIGNFFVEKSKIIGNTKEAKKLYNKYKSSPMYLMELERGFAVYFRKCDSGYPAQYFHYFGALVRFFMNGYKPSSQKFTCNKIDAGAWAGMMRHVSDYVCNSKEYTPPISEGLRNDVENLEEALFSE